MRWQGGRRSTNIEDRRGRGGPIAIGGGLMGLLVIGVGLLLGADPRQLLGMLEDQGGGGPPPAEQQPIADFASVVLADTEDVWTQLFADQRQGSSYRVPTMVLFDGSVQSACGSATSAIGPFYCPGDEKIYLDLTFFRELEARHDAPGDFARAYVIAHEVGHHVQTVLGISQQVSRESRAVSEVEANRLSVRQELQADCFAGVWAHHAEKQRQILEAGDIEEALGAASAIGDDTLQRQAQGHVVPDSFTHGSSEQRVRWFRQGFETGTIQACDTFRLARL